MKKFSKLAAVLLVFCVLFASMTVLIVSAENTETPVLYEVYEPDYATAGTDALEANFVKGSTTAPVIDTNGDIYIGNYRGFLIDTNSPETTDGVFEFTYNLSSAVNLAIAFRATDSQNYSAYEVQYNYGYGRNYISNTVDGVRTASGEVAKKIHTYGEDHKVRFEVRGKYLKVVIDDAVIYEGESEYVGDGAGRFALFVDGNGDKPDNAPNVTIKDVKITYAVPALVYEPDYATAGTDALEANFVKGSTTAPVIDTNGDIYIGNYRGFLIDTNSPETTDGVFEFTYNLSSAVNLAIAFRATDSQNYSAYEVQYNYGYGRNYISNTVDGVRTASGEVAKKIHTYGEDHKVRFEVRGKYLKVVIDDAVIYEGESEYVGDGAGRFALFVDGNGDKPDNAPNVTIKDVKITYKQMPHVHAPSEPVRENEEPATCKGEGSYDEVVYCSDEECGEELSRVTMPIEIDDHKLQEVEEEPATTEKTGVKAHYLCTVCEKLFSDAEGTVEVTAEDLVIEKKEASNEDNKTEDNKTEDNKTEDNKTEDNKTEDNKTEDNKTEDNVSPSTNDKLAVFAISIFAILGAVFVVSAKLRKA